MRITTVPMISQLIASFFHLPLCLLLTFKADMGIYGLGLATSITNFNLLLLTIIQCCFNKKVKQAVTCPGKESLRGWGEYLKVAIPSAVILCSEWWAFEVLTIVAGLISVEAQAVQTTVTSVSALMSEIPLSYQEATAAIIGNCIGANNVPLAIRFYKLSSWITVITVVVLQLVILFGRYAIATYYLAQEESQ